MEERVPSMDYVYLPIRDARKCVGARVNLCAAVVWTGNAKKSRGSDYVITLKIVDQSYSETFTSVNFFANDKTKLPLVRAIGDIICLHQVEGIIVLAATNRPHAIDAALLRPGRFDLVLYVPPPDAEDRYDILRVQTRKMSLGEDVDLREIAKCTDFFTGADLEWLCNEAGMVALRERLSAECVCNRHFLTARDSIKPSLTQSMIDQYASAQFGR